MDEWIETIKLNDNEWMDGWKLTKTTQETMDRCMMLTETTDATMDGWANGN